MKNFFKWLQIWAGIFVFLLVVGLGTYFALKARQTTNPTTDSNAGNIYVTAGETLTATKRNTLADMTAEARTVQSTNYIVATSSRTNIPWMTKTITLKRPAHVQIFVSWPQWQPSTYWSVNYGIYIDWTICTRIANWSSVSGNISISNFNLSYWIDLDVWDHTISIKTLLGQYTGPRVCGGGGTSTAHIPCTMNIQAFY